MYEYIFFNIEKVMNNETNTTGDYNFLYFQHLQYIEKQFNLLKYSLIVNLLKYCPWNITFL